jgi:hypothetical protein
MVEDRRSIISLRFSRTNPVTRYPKLSDLTFANSVAQPVSRIVTRHGTDSRVWVDVFYTGPYVHVEFAASAQVGQNDQRPTSWRCGTDRRLQAQRLEELGRAGFQDLHRCAVPTIAIESS